MAVPKRKLSKSRKNNRRAHHSIKAVVTVECPHCGERKLAHRVCRSCGK
ncbi:MAG: 50S ribosomal protein L32 [bacterium]